MQDGGNLQDVLVAQLRIRDIEQRQLRRVGDHFADAVHGLKDERGGALDVVAGDEEVVQRGADAGLNNELEDLDDVLEL